MKQVPISQILNPHDNKTDLPAIGMHYFIDECFVDIDQLIPRQEFVEKEIVDIKRKGKNLSTIYVVYHEGKLFLLDGHHTVAAKKLNGQKRVKAMYLETNDIKMIPEKVQL